MQKIKPSSGDVPKKAEYLFILCPPYCGSTVLWRLIGTSANVSSLPDEGQVLPEVKQVMRDNPWDENRDMPWPRIKRLWHTYWDDQKPLLLEKSPPNLLRAQAIATHFSPVHFVLMVRDPYAHCEGLMRRNGWDAPTAARFCIRCLRRQIDNQRGLGRVLTVHYEDLVRDPAAVATRLATFHPLLGDIDTAAKFEVHSISGLARRGIVDLNEKKLRNLRRTEIEQLNEVFEPHLDVLRHWGFQHYQPSKGHDWKRRLTALQLFCERLYNNLGAIFRAAYDRLRRHSGDGR